MEEQRAAFRQRFSPPPSWVPMPESQEFLVQPLSASSCLQALRDCLRTSHPEWFGQGRDILARHGGAYTLELAHAWRVQNRPLWTKYRAELQKMASDLDLCGLRPPDVDVLPELREPARALGDLDRASGEEFLLHGTTAEAVSSILREGLNERFTGRAAFGFGTYLCEDAGKADQYVTAARNSDLASLRAALGLQRVPARDLFYMFVCRTALGFPVHTLDSEVSLEGHQVWASGRSHRAQKRELSQIPGTRPAIRYHSQIMEVTQDPAAFNYYGHQRVYRYREFVVPHSDRVYPEYLVAVRRVATSGPPPA